MLQVTLPIEPQSAMPDSTDGPPWCRLMRGSSLAAPPSVPIPPVVQHVIYVLLQRQVGVRSRGSGLVLEVQLHGRDTARPYRLEWGEAGDRGALGSHRQAEGECWEKLLWKLWTGRKGYVVHCKRHSAWVLPQRLHASRYSELLQYLSLIFASPLAVLPTLMTQG